MASKQGCSPVASRTWNKSDKQSTRHLKPTASTQIRIDTPETGRYTVTSGLPNLRSEIREGLRPGQKRQRVARWLSVTSAQHSEDVPEFLLLGRLRARGCAGSCPLPQRIFLPDPTRGDQDPVRDSRACHTSHQRASTCLPEPQSTPFHVRPTAFGAGAGSPWWPCLSGGPLRVWAEPAETCPWASCELGFCEPTSGSSGGLGRTVTLAGEAEVAPGGSEASVHSPVPSTSPKLLRSSLTTTFPGECCHSTQFTAEETKAEVQSLIEDHTAKGVVKQGLASPPSPQPLL